MSFVVSFCIPLSSFSIEDIIVRFYSHLREHRVQKLVMLTGRCFSAWRYRREKYCVRNREINFNTSVKMNFCHCGVTAGRVIDESSSAYEMNIH